MINYETPEDTDNADRPRRFDRRELMKIRIRAEYLAQLPGSNPLWIRAYENLASAADYVDALIYRAVGAARNRQERDNAVFDE